MERFYTIEVAVTTVPCSLIEGPSSLQLRREQLIVVEDGTMSPLTDAVILGINNIAPFYRNGHTIALNTNLKLRQQANQ